MRAAEFQVSLDELPKVYPGLARALAESGEAPARIAELIQTHLHVRCVGCRQTIPGEALVELALAQGQPPADSDSAPLKRLRLGYCVKPDCNSRYYVLSASTGMVAWPSLFDRTRHFMTHPPSAALVEPPTKGASSNKPGATPDAPKDTVDPGDGEAGRPPLSFQERWRRAKFAALGAVVGLGLLFWWWQSGARIPGLGPAPREFQVVPTPGVDPQVSPAAPTTPRGATNAPRSFRVVQ